MKRTQHDIDEQKRLFAAMPFLRDYTEAQMRAEYARCIENPDSCKGTNKGEHSHTCSNGHTWTHVGWQSQIEELDNPGSFDASHLCSVCGEDVRWPDFILKAAA